MLQRLAGWSFGLWRCWVAWFVYRYAQSMTAGLFMFVWSELLMGVLSLLNSAVARRMDRRLVGWFLPFLYACSLFVIPCGFPAPFLDWSLFVVGTFRVVATCYLGASFASGVPSFYRLVHRGPYRLVRHPIEASGLACRFVFWLGNPCWWNLAAFLTLSCVAVTVVRIEETFLEDVPIWRAYRHIVRWRLLPGVW